MSEPTSITLVELLVRPEVVYTILDALYEDTYNTPEDNIDAIRVIEKAMQDQEFPLERGTFEEQIQVSSNQSPEMTEWYDIDVVFPLPVGH